MAADENPAGAEFHDCDLIIFDCDGVLVDSEVIAVEMEARMLTEAGFPMTADDVAETCVGLSYPDMVAMLERRFGRQVPETLNQAMQLATLDEFPRSLKPVPGIAELLQSSMKERCVASSSNPDRIAMSLEITGLHELFVADRLYSATMVANGKPAPDLFLHAAGTLDHDPQRCVVIEDSPHGVQAALAADMQVIGFVGGSHARPSLTERLRAAGATIIVDTHGAVAGLTSGPG